MKPKLKECGGCNKMTILWKAKRKLPDGTISPALCKECANKTSNKPPKLAELRKAINKVSSKEQKRQAAYLVLRKEYMKQYPQCMFKDCGRPSEECHHIRGRTGEYLLDTTEWMAVCSTHHRYIHDNDKECRELGYLKSRLGK